MSWHKKLVSIVLDVEFLVTFGTIIFMWIFAHDLVLGVILGAVAYIIVNFIQKARPRFTIFGTTTPTKPGSGKS